MTTKLSRQTSMMKRITLMAGLVFLSVIGSLHADDAIGSAQQALKDQGFYYGKVTGRNDADTTAAIRRYQIRNGLKITGELNTETRQSLRITSTTAPTKGPQPPSNGTANLREENEGRSQIAPEKYRTPREPSPSTYAAEPDRYRPVRAGIFEHTPYELASPDVQQRVIADAQIFLARRGYYRSEIDGIYGPGTEFALRAFQSRTGLSASGRFDVPTLNALGLMPGRHVLRSGRPFPRPIYRGEWIPE